MSTNLRLLVNGSNNLVMPMNFSIRMATTLLSLRSWLRYVYICIIFCVSHLPFVESLYYPVAFCIYLIHLSHLTIVFLIFEGTILVAKFLCEQCCRNLASTLLSLFILFLRIGLGKLMGSLVLLDLSSCCMGFLAAPLRELNDCF